MKITRRNVIKDIALSASAFAIAPNISFAKSVKEKKLQKLKRKYQSFCLPMEMLEAAGEKKRSWL